jgi:hypothetical protein
MKQSAATFVLAMVCAGLPDALPAEEASGQVARINETPITKANRDHWSFRTLTRPGVPAVKSAQWARNPIDPFIGGRLEKKKLAPSPEADRRTLMRRVTFGLNGLAPLAADIDAFIADKSPNAYERMVDRALASPAYGERWAQYWLDLARFAETDGFEHDLVRPQAWRYRDWVIRALNSDLPYDQFVRQQLAGDELFHGDADARQATAFCLSGPDMPDINSQDERRNNLLNEMTGTVGAVFLGLQIGCAQCHDHMYDPISQADFYRLRAIFEPSVQVQRGKSVSALSESSAQTKPSYLLVRGDWQRRGPEVQPAFPRIANPAGERVAAAPSNAKTSRRRAALAEWITRSDNPLTARVIVNRVWQHHFGHGLSRTPSDFGTMGDEPSHPRLLDWLATELIRQDWSLKSLHRLILTSATYRQASRPNMYDSSQAVMSEAWMRGREIDPTNRWLGRMNRRRLTGEEIRDSMLAVSELLNRQMGGPSVRPPLPREVVATLLRPTHWQFSSNRADHFRRSVYVFVRRNLHFPMFATFDRPDGNASCPQRTRSTTAIQSLLLLNSPMMLHAARHLAGRTYGGPEDDLNARFARLFRRALGRAPSADELQRCREFYDVQVKEIRQNKRQPDSLALPIPMPPTASPEEAAAWTDFAIVMLNLSEFIFID